MKSRAEKNKNFRKKIIHEENQKKIKKIVKVISIILIITFLILGYGIFIEAKTFVVNEYKITNNLIPGNFHGVKIVHISDILYNSLNDKDLENIKNKVNLLKPDILVFTGNLKKENYSFKKEELEKLNTFFKNLNSNIIKYAVKGKNDDESFNIILENTGFNILNNESQLLYYKNNTPIKIIGYDTNGFSKIENENLYTICLMHNPDDLSKMDNCNLSLAGANLGGEIKIPFYKGILTDYKYMNNYYKLNNTELYISNGLGNNHSIRLFNYPSINLYRITKY